MKRNAAISMALALSLLLNLLSACAAGAKEFTAQPTAPQATAPAELVPAPAQSLPPAPEPSPDQERARQAAANRMALELLRAECAQKGGNVILSPLSIETALSMTSEGASGGAKEALEALGLSAGQGAALSQDDGDSVLSIANSMWFNEKLSGKINQTFKDALSSEYGAEEGFFTPKSSDSVREINGWVKEHTKEKIDSIVTENDLDENALAVLINAIYFDGKWTEPFEAPARPGSFYTPHGLQEAQLMADRVETYFEYGGFTGFSKSYKDGYEFIGILPDELGLDLTKLDIDAFLSSETEAYDVDIKIPKFELEYANSLKETLTGLGLGSIFKPHALDGVLTSEALALGDTAWVDDVVHKTYMRMYEAGTEAAASTAVVVRYGTTALAAPRERRQVILDRPFAFLIRDVESERIVFCGAVNSVK